MAVGGEWIDGAEAKASLRSYCESSEETRKMTRMGRGRGKC